MVAARQQHQGVSSKSKALMATSLDIRRALGLAPYTRRKRRLVYWLPNTHTDAFAAVGPVGFSRVAACGSGLSLDGPPCSGGEDVPAVVSTFAVRAPSQRTMLVLHEVAALLAELADARRVVTKH